MKIKISDLYEMIEERNDKTTDIDLIGMDHCPSCGSNQYDPEEMFCLTCSLKRNSPSQK